MIAVLNGSLVVGPDQVDLGKDCAATQGCGKILDVRNWLSIWNSDVV